MCVAANVKLKCVAPVERHVRSMFAHSIFEGSSSKEGFHGTHGTPSGSATDLDLKTVADIHVGHSI